MPSISPQKKKISKPSSSAKDGAKALTPMMAQYMEIKAANADSILFYRMGDFFEMFFDDAVQASQTLGIHLTHRGKHEGKDIPMCGVPVKKGEDYLQKLIGAGFKVAVCEQMEAPEEAKKRGYKAVVRRDVVRLVTPGTITEDNLLDTHAYNFLTALFKCQITQIKPQNVKGAEVKNACDGYALASFDLSTGEFLVSEVLAQDLEGELVRLNPRELLVPDSQYDYETLQPVLEHLGTILSPVSAGNFTAKAGQKVLKKYLNVLETQGFGDFTKAELSAMGAILTYIELTQIGQKPAVKPPQKQGSQHVMVMDSATRISLELVRSVKGDKASSLLGALDLTVTGAGSRELAARLTSPLLDIKIIAARLAAVSFMIEETNLRDELRQALRGCPDISRALSRLSLSRGGPRDLGIVKNGLDVAQSIVKILHSSLNSLERPHIIEDLILDLQVLKQSVLARLSQALKHELPLYARDGGFVKRGYHQELDDSKDLRDKSREVIMALQLKYSELTKIKTLKVKHNNVLGYFIEVTPSNASMMDTTELKAVFIHRQTLASAVRYTTTELSELESRIVTAAERALSIEQGIFSELVQDILQSHEGLSQIAMALGHVDLYGALGELAVRENYCKPKVDDSLRFEINQGRHPVVEQALAKASEGSFIENDCYLSADQEVEPVSEENNASKTFTKDSRLWLLTGPNMAGKSTFLRQNALIAIMAQAGSFVPARSVHIGVIDRLFSRVGASDDLARGRSTFMVEMIETAGILNQAGSRSLVILDEIGRGTATYDGLSIAWATVEYLNKVNCARALFATHYHELTILAKQLEYVSNATIDVREWQDDIVFLHKVVPGSADRSYGIQVAKLAGLPDSVIARAQEVLSQLENKDAQNDSKARLAELPLFALLEIPDQQADKNQRAGELLPNDKTKPSGFSEPAREDIAQLEAMQSALALLEPDNMTPKQALEALYKLKGLS